MKETVPEKFPKRTFGPTAAKNLKESDIELRKQLLGTFVWPEKKTRRGLILRSVSRQILFENAA